MALLWTRAFGPIQYALEPDWLAGAAFEHAHLACELVVPHLITEEVSGHDPRQRI
jgi:hypothetical protein